jgi:hypothetical protein
LEDLTPLPTFRTQCGKGYGLAANPALGLLVTSDVEKNTLSVWGLPDGAIGCGASEAGAAFIAGGHRVGLRLVCTLGGAGSQAPMQFKFNGGVATGYLAFTPLTGDSSSGSARPLLLVTDAGADAVHLVDVVGRRPRSHAGYLAAPGSIAGPRGVAASGASPLVAVSAWKTYESGDHVVVVFRGSGAVWEAVRVIGGGLGRPGRGYGQLNRPYGLRFSGDGSGICVADSWNHRVSLFRVGDGRFVRHIATGFRDLSRRTPGLRHPSDVEEVEGGWLVVRAFSHTVEFVSHRSDGDGSRWPSLGKAGGGHGSGDGEFEYPSALAVVPGLGLVVREWGNAGRVQGFVTPDIIAMAAMSHSRVAWMGAVARCVLRRRQRFVGEKGAPACGVKRTREVRR